MGSPRFKPYPQSDGTRYHFWCPGCNAHHAITVKDDGSGWQFNGDLVNPTVSPSIKVTTYDGQVCHSFIRGGRIEFCGDSTHGLAGKTVELPEIPEGSPLI